MRWGSILLEDYLIYVCHLHQLGDEEAFKHVKLIHPHSLWRRLHFPSLKSRAPRSLDLTPYDFFWVYVKSRVNAIKPRDLPTLEARICDTCANITPDMLSNVGAVCVRKWL